MIGSEVPQGFSRSDRDLLASGFGMMLALVSNLLLAQPLIAHLMNRRSEILGFDLRLIGFESSASAGIPHILPRLRPQSPTMIHIHRLANHPTLCLMPQMSRETTSTRLLGSG
jgi:hypothetical protein